ncbi:MAG: hypothetical protein ACLPJH_09530 [Myxococcaceae bacterium]
MRSPFFALVALTVGLCLLASGCIGQSTALPGDNTGAASTTGDAGTGGSAASLDLPCAAGDVLVASCLGCHGSPTANGAPQSLNTLAALQAPSPSYPSQSNGQRAVVRMASTTAPMPPSPNPGVPAAEQTAFAAWVDAGMPAGTCSSVPDAGTVAVDPAFSGPDVCTSGQTYTGSEGGDMRPGEACVSCHQANGGPGFNAGGTVYPTGHEPNDCVASASAGAVVTVTDSSGASVSFTANGNGNFYGNVPGFPITAVVTFDGGTRAMTTPVSSGDCNSCHTEAGTNGAPGRIALP